MEVNVKDLSEVEKEAMVGLIQGLRKKHGDIALIPLNLISIMNFISDMVPVKDPDDLASMTRVLATMLLSLTEQTMDIIGDEICGAAFEVHQKLGQASESSETASEVILKAKNLYN